ncbi:MAG: hypothetical protein ACPL5F_01800 [Moorellaceae bacterium]
MNFVAVMGFWATGKPWFKLDDGDLVYLVGTESPRGPCLVPVALGPEMVPPHEGTKVLVAGCLAQYEDKFYVVATTVREMPVKAVKRVVGWRKDAK